MKEFVTLVNEHDQTIGKEEKLAAHQKGLLHRAFSIFIFNQNKQMLLQKRAAIKYHSANLWSNACCGHPRPEETTMQAAQRRLFEETGITCQLHQAGSFTYRANLSSSNLIEHEIDHLFYGFFDGTPSPNPHEISQLRWISQQQLFQELEQHPHLFTAWFCEAAQAIYRIGNTL